MSWLRRLLRRLGRPAGAASEEDSTAEHAAAHGRLRTLEAELRLLRRR